MRVANRLLAALLALGLAVAGVIATVEIVLAALDDPYWLVPWPTWRQWALEHTWTGTPVQLTSYALCAAGLILLVLAFAPHRPLALEARSDSSDVNTYVRRAALESSLARAARGVDGIGAAAVKVSRRSVRVRARSNRRDVGGLKDTVAQAVGAQLERLRLAHPLPLRVQVKSRSN